MIVVSAVVEGDLDEAVAIRLIRAAGHIPGTVYGKQGLGYIKKKIRNFNQAAQHFHYLVLVDFKDTHLPCPPAVIPLWLPKRSPKMSFRLAVRKLESWIIADRSGLSTFLGIHVDRVPLVPEQVSDPKQFLVNLARSSRISRVRSAFVPESGSTAQVGKLYTSELMRFVKQIWDPHVARRNAPSLDRCMGSLEGLA